jgi:hypothetical protein
MSRLASYRHVRANTRLGAVRNDAHLNNSPMYGPGRTSGAVVALSEGEGNLPPFSI